MCLPPGAGAPRLPDSPALPGGQDATTAKAVAFHRDVMVKCVTHEGDLFDPQGTLTGGSRAGSASLLTKLHALK